MKLSSGKLQFSGNEKAPCWYWNILSPAHAGEIQYKKTSMGEGHGHGGI